MRFDPGFLMRVAAALIIALASSLAAAGAEEPQDSAQAEEHKWFWYEDGLNLESRDGRYRAHIELRGQLRLSDIDLDAEAATPTAPAQPAPAPDPETP